MQHYAIVYSPNINVDKINIFRKKYDPQWNVIPPHITLVFPFLNIPEVCQVPLLVHTHSSSTEGIC